MLCSSTGQALSLVEYTIFSHSEKRKILPSYAESHASVLRRVPLYEACGGTTGFTHGGATLSSFLKKSLLFRKIGVA
jgi:hypothetical protein